MSSDSSIIEVQELERMTEAEKELWERRSIYKLPACVTNTNKTAYTPEMVSFGPYHYGNENLKEMELHKARALNHFLKRSRLYYKDCYQSLIEIVGELMDAYDWLDTNFDDKMNRDAFMEIMIRDGIFMLEMFGDGEKKASGYAYNDPIFSKHGDVFFIPHIKRDMLILENQIPIKVLHRLYQLQHRGEDANKVVFQFFFPEKNPKKAPTNSLHVLDMYRRVILGSYPPSSTKEEKNTIRIGGDDIIRSVVQLKEAGIKIQKSKTSGLRDIRFKNGILQLPRIIVDDIAESLFLNLIAYERFHIVAGNDVTDYVFFMDNLIDGELDIRLLRSKDIMQHAIGSDDEAIKFFKSLSKGISLDITSPVATIYNSVNVYSIRHRFRAKVCHKYFTNPWASISFVAGIFLFVLSMSDSTFAVLDFFKKK